MKNINPQSVIATSVIAFLSACGGQIAGTKQDDASSAQSGAQTPASGSVPYVAGTNGSGIPTCGPSAAGLYAFYRLEPLNCNAASCPAPALAAHVVVTDDPNYCVNGGAASGHSVLNFPPLREVNAQDYNGLFFYGGGAYQNVTYARTGTFVDAQPANWMVIPDNRDIGLEQPYGTSPNAPFASFTQNGSTVGTDFAQAQNLTFEFDGKNVTNVSYALAYASQGNVTAANALRGNIPHATLCSTLDPNVPDDATLAKEFDTSTMPYFFYNAGTGVGYNANDIRYDVTGVLTDRADFCSLLQSGSGVPSDVRSLEIRNDNPPNGPSGFTQTGPLTLYSQLTATGSYPHFNVPGLGPLLWSGTAQVTLSSDANTVTLDSFSIHPHAYAYIFPLNGGPATHNIKCDALRAF